MLSFSETFFLKTTRPVVLIFPALFSADKSKIMQPTSMTVWIVKHQPNVCKFLLVLEVQILDTAFSSGVKRCKSKTFSIFSILGFALCSTPLFHHHFINYPVLFILCLISVKRVTSLIVAVYLLNHWLIYVWAMHSVLWVIYSSSSRREWRSVLCYLFCARLIRISCIILTFILSPVTCVNLIWLCTVWTIGYLFHPFIFVLLRYYLMCVKLQLRKDL